MTKEDKIELEILKFVFKDGKYYNDFYEMQMALLEVMEKQEKEEKK